MSKTRKALQGAPGCDSGRMTGRSCSAAMASHTSPNAMGAPPSLMPISTLGLMVRTAAARSAHTGPSWQYGSAWRTL